MTIITEARKSILVSFLILSLFYNLSAQKFVIGILPDTQGEVNTRPEMFMKQMEWLAAKRDSLNMLIVLHVGDIVDYNNVTHYERASKGFAILDAAKVPYAVCLGNHDTGLVSENSGSAAPGNTNTNLRQTEKFNTYFPVERFSKQKGRFEKNKSDNAYYTFKAGGLKWLVLSLEFCTRPRAVDWANTIIRKFPKYNVIVLTHSYLNAKGEIEQTNSGYGDLSPQQIFERLISVNSNVVFVFSGHTGTSVYRKDMGVHGNQIWQILQDYQGQDAGGGFIRLLEIDPEAGTLTGKMYSPFYNVTKDDYSKINISGLHLKENKR